MGTSQAVISAAQLAAMQSLQNIPVPPPRASTSYCKGDYLKEGICIDWALEHPGAISYTDINNFCVDNPGHRLCACINSPLTHASLPVQCDNDCLVSGYKPGHIQHIIDTTPCSVTDCSQISQTPGTHNIQKNTSLVQACGGGIIEITPEKPGVLDELISNDEIFGINKYVFLFIIMIMIIILTVSSSSDQKKKDKQTFAQFMEMQQRG